jgi:phosphoglycerate kinase
LAKKKEYNIPVDVVVANAFSNDAETKIVDVDSILTDGKVLMQDQNHWLTSKVMMESKTILWNGPLGVLKWKILLMELLNWVIFPLQRVVVTLRQ